VPPGPDLPLRRTGKDHRFVGPGPGKDPNRVLDLLVTRLVVGAGTKPLHDLITQIQTSSGSSKAQASSTTPAS